MKKSSDYNDWGNTAEVHSFIIVKRVVNRLLDGFFHFKKRKGEIVAGSATFFSIISFGPILLWMISLAGIFFTSQVEARDFVLGVVKNNMPNLAPWILDSIKNIVTAQLEGNTGFSFINFLVLLYSSLGIVTSLFFGVNTISKSESKGGFFVEDIRNMGMGLSVAFFMAGFMILSHKPTMLHWLSTSYEGVNSISNFFINYNLLPAIFALCFFTFFYQWSTPDRISFKESLYGASSFVGCFAVGKSFYWVYHLYTKDSMGQAYGNFYTLVVAVMWVYFLMCAFFYGASVACVRERELYNGQIAVMMRKKVANPAAGAKQESSGPHLKVAASHGVIVDKDLSGPPGIPTHPTQEQILKKKVS